MPSRIAHCAGEPRRPADTGGDRSAAGRTASHCQVEERVSAHASGRRAGDASTSGSAWSSSDAGAAVTRAPSRIGCRWAVSRRHGRYGWYVSHCISTERSHCEHIRRGRRGSPGAGRGLCRQCTVAQFIRGCSSECSRWITRHHSNCNNRRCAAGVATAITQQWRAVCCRKRHWRSRRPDVTRCQPPSRCRV